MVTYDELPAEVQEAFDEAMSDFSDSATEAAKEKYANGVARAVEAGSYAEGLANRFNMDPSDFSGVTQLWEDGVSETDADEWEQALSQAGIDEKYRDNLITALID